MFDCPTRLAARTLRDPDSSDPEEVAVAWRHLESELSRHEPAVIQLCQRIVRDHERALELSQDTMVTALQRVHTFRGDSSFRSWLLGIARFTALRATAKRRDLLVDDGIVEIHAGGRTPDSLMRRDERDELVRAASLAVLDPLEQEAVYLRYEEGLGQQQITHVLGLTNASGARGLLVRCRRKLKAEVQRRLDALGHGRSFFETRWD